MARIRLVALLVLGFGMLTSIGCGPSHYQPVVEITEDGAPLKLSDKGVAEIQLYAESDKNFATAETVTKDGDVYRVKGRTGTGVPAGKYILSIAVKDPYDPSTAKDKYGGKYFRDKGKPVEIKDSATPIKIEVSTK